MTTADAPNTTPTNRLVLSRAEAWVVHHVVLTHLLDGEAPTEDDEQPWWALETIQKLESGTRRFTAFEAWRLRCALLEYVREDATPDADVALGLAVVETIEEAFDQPPAAIC